ncbi:helix-turn-helix domain-containing protein [Rhodococcus tibetensis]|uniref:AraC family transcriptional regulator n=1 Tax=Rhodococcus tibetensis TaxID=2965064 RepID=A0ABT1QB44_9NOCA|nr:AraC family transcriptional regulator [Rhodococcus sp. FXJ9.536]MCQ4119496.1 AraC family transcriptional regulator [Rhodococcus sp. FXJ9.536]
MYSERSSAFAGAVVWEKTAVEGDGAVLPDGCMDLIWMDGDVVVAGPDSRAYIARTRPGDRLVGMRFSPGTLPRLLGTPADELANARVPLADLLGNDDTARLLSAIADHPDPATQLEEFAAARRRFASRSDGRIPVIVNLLARQCPIREVADRVGVSERQLHRLCRREFGYGPKVLARILRLQWAMELAGSVSAAEAASLAGFADQAHLIRESHELTGRPFGRLVMSS